MAGNGVFGVKRIDFLYNTDVGKICASILDPAFPVAQEHGTMSSEDSQPKTG
jgi:hypothetical protein